MKKLLIISAIICSAFITKAQQIEHWTQFYANEYLINPAVAGAEQYFNARALYRDQWVGVVDAPRTYMLSVDGPIVNEKMGIGGSIFSDVTGPVSRTGFQASYAYHLKLTDAMKLSFTLSAGILQYAVDGNRVETQRSLDPALTNAWGVAYAPDFGLGTRLYGKNWHVGIYVPQVTNSKAQLFNDYTGTDNYLSRHYYLNAGYKYDIGSSDFAVEANFLGRYVHPIDIFDLQLRAIYKDMVWVGGLLRSPLISDQAPNAVGIMAGYNFQNNLTIGYAYDLPMGVVAQSSSGTHEVMLGIRFSKKNKREPVE